MASIKIARNNDNAGNKLYTDSQDVFDRAEKKTVSEVLATLKTSLAATHKLVDDFLNGAADGDPISNLTELIAAINDNQNTLNTLANALTASDIVNDLTTGGTNKVLSAEQGKVLNDNKIDKSNIVDDLATDDASKVLSAAQGKALDGRLSAVEAKGDETGIAIGDTLANANTYDGKIRIVVEDFDPAA